MVRPVTVIGEVVPVPVIPPHVARYEVIGLPPVIGVPGVEWAGLIPEELQNWALFTAGLNANAKEAHAGSALLSFLKSPAAVAVFKAKGLDPAP